jgi:hypothetical protein
MVDGARGCDDVELEARLARLNVYPSRSISVASRVEVHVTGTKLNFQVHLSSDEI